MPVIQTLPDRPLIVVGRALQQTNSPRCDGPGGIDFALRHLPARAQNRHARALPLVQAPNAGDLLLRVNDESAVRSLLGLKRLAGKPRRGGIRHGDRLQSIANGLSAAATRAERSNRF
jgi:hypothetical protein